MPPIPLKRPRSEYDIPSGHELPGYFSHKDDRAAYHMTGETNSIGASYGRYLRSGKISAYGSGGSEPGGRSLGGGFIGHPTDDMRMSGGRGFDPIAGKGQNIGIPGGKPEMSLPPDASNTLFVEGLPSNCTRREVSHIFRPFVGFKEVRLVNKEFRNSGSDHVVLCFVDFGSLNQAATVMDALQGEHNIPALLSGHERNISACIYEILLMLLITVYDKAEKGVSAEVEAWLDYGVTEGERRQALGFNGGAE